MSITNSITQSITRSITTSITSPFGGGLLEFLEGKLGAGNFGYVNLIDGAYDTGGTLITGASLNGTGTLGAGGLVIDKAGHLLVTVADPTSWTTFTHFARALHDNAHGNNTDMAVLHARTTDGNWFYGGGGTSSGNTRSGYGENSVNNSRTGNVTPLPTWTAGEDWTQVLDYVNVQGYKNKGTAYSLATGLLNTPLSNYSPGSVGVTTTNWHWGGANTSTNLFSGTLKVLVITTTTPSQAVRESIVDYINAL